MKLLDALADLLYPPKCPFCGRVLDHREDGMCSRCPPLLPRTETTDHKTVEGCVHCLAPLWYRDMVPDAVHRYKFNGGRDHAVLFGTMMAECVSRRWDRPVDAVTWAPLSKKRLRERGYDQAGLLAARVGELLDLPVVSLLEKVRNVRPQSGLEDEELRRRNVRDAYRLRAGVDCAGQHLLLVDDVITTGSTLGECAACLNRAGAASVVALGFAWARK